MLKVLVTGANGQVGQALQSISGLYKQIEFTFMGSKELDITSKESIGKVLEENSYNYLINLAAYTNVDNAEIDPQKAYLVNTTAVEDLAKAASKYGVVLLHLSTDFVFDGNKNSPYTPEDYTCALNVYGKSKLEAEKQIIQSLTCFYIIRSSWLYSEFGHNFKKTMLGLAMRNKQIKVVNDQIGTPTNAIDLCKYLIAIIEQKPAYGIYHFAGPKVCSWFEFAKSIFLENNLDVEVLPISSKEFASKAIRPNYSALQTSELEPTIKS